MSRTSSSAPVHEKKQHVEKEDCFVGGAPMFYAADFLDINDAVVCIQLENRYFATGIYVKVPKLNRNCILTCEHVVVKQHTEVKFLHQRKRSPFTISLASSVKLAWNDQWVYDFQLLSLSDENLDLINSKDVDPILLEKQPTEPEVGDFVMIIQHPEGAEKQYSGKNISFVDGAYIGYNANTLFGSSGGAIVWDGKLIGLHQEANHKKKVNQGTLISQIMEIIEHCTTICPNPTCESTACYAGEQKDGVFCGPGKIECASCGSYEEGTYMNGKLCKGSRTFGGDSDEKSDCYQGDFVNGRFDGVGKYTFGCGAVYDGEWKYGMPNGRCEVIFPNGEKNAYIWERRDEGTDILTWHLAVDFPQETHEGRWKDFVAGEGKSSVVWKYVYEGGWLHGKAHGRCVLKNNNSTYEGEWDTHTRYGKGLETFRNGMEKEGEFLNAKLNGNGRWKYSPRNNGEYAEYVGDFVDDMRHGEGIFTFENGATFKCQWVRGKPNGKCAITFGDGRTGDGVWEGEDTWDLDKCTFASGKVYVGYWMHLINSEDRNCLYRWPSGKVYCGTLLDGKCDGYGRMIRKTYVYVGEWHSDKSHGTGEITFANGDTLTGRWRNGHRHGVVICCYNGMHITKTYVDGKETWRSKLSRIKQTMPIIPLCRNFLPNNHMGVV